MLGIKLVLVVSGKMCYVGCMQMHTQVRDDGLLHYWMGNICVDGICGENTRDFGYQFFTIKFDVNYWEKKEDSEGYIDDSDEMVGWDSPYKPIPLAYGPIDEKIWLEEGYVVAEGEAF